MAGLGGRLCLVYSPASWTPQVSSIPMRTHTSSQEYMLVEQFSPKPSRSLTTPANDQVGDCGPKLIPTPKHLFVFRAVVDTGLPVSAHKCCIHDCDAAGDGFDIQMAGSLHMAVAYGAFPSHLGWTVICLCSMECTEASTCQV